MKLEISTDEWWPIYLLSHPRETLRTDYVIDIPDDIYNEYKQAMLSFKAIQEKLAPYHQRCCIKEQETYEKIFDQQKRKKLIVEEYAHDADPQHCGKCDAEQCRAIYQGGIYLGCEQCASIEIPKDGVWPSMHEDSIRLRRASSNTPAESVQTSDWDDPIVA